MTTLIILSVVLAVVVIAVLAAALIKIRQDLEDASKNLATLAGALAMVEQEHLKPLEPAVKAINAQFDTIVAALVFYLVSTILALRKITSGLDDAINGVVGIIEKSAPVGEVVTTINQNLDAGVDLLEGLLVKKAGMEDAVGLVEGLYPGAAAQGFRNFPESKTVRAPRISEVYTKGTLT